MKHVFLLVGARPNFIKVAPLHRALAARGVAATLVHTGQHYDAKMSDVFFKELGIPAPDHNLAIGPGDRITQTKKIVDALIPLLSSNHPDALVVFGDVTSTAAGAMAGVVAGVKVVHVEAGLRSFNWRMPEELNRMIADHHSDLLFVTEPVGMENLKNESIPLERAHLVGNVMIDSLRAIESRTGTSTIASNLGVAPRGYALLTLHRPESVDDPAVLKYAWETIGLVAARIPVVYPYHVRTKQRLEAAALAAPAGMTMIEPVGYTDMIALVKNAAFVLTDSGGLQEETSALNVPCLTLRNETERPITVEIGTSEITGLDRAKILDAVDRVLSGRWKQGALHPLWDGRAAERIADILRSA